MYTIVSHFFHTLDVVLIALAKENEKDSRAFVYLAPFKLSFAAKRSCSRSLNRPPDKSIGAHASIIQSNQQVDPLHTTAIIASYGELSGNWDEKGRVRLQ